MTSDTSVPVWLVKTTWSEDEAAATEQWEVMANTAHDAIREVSKHLRFQPHHVEASIRPPETHSATQQAKLQLGQVRRMPPE